MPVYCVNYSTYGDETKISSIHEETAPLGGGLSIDLIKYGIAKKWDSSYLVNPDHEYVKNHQDNEMVIIREAIKIKVLKDKLKNFVG